MSVLAIMHFFFIENIKITVYMSKDRRITEPVSSPILLDLAVITKQPLQLLVRQRLQDHVL